MAFELRELIEEEDAMMRQRHLAGHGDLAPTDQADVGDGVVRGAKGRDVTKVVCPLVTSATRMPGPRHRRHWHGMLADTTLVTGSRARGDHVLDARRGLSPSHPAAELRHAGPRHPWD
jgi:hypothetical protein